MSSCCSPLKNPHALLALVLLIASLSLLQRPASAEKKSYVVYLGGHSHGREGAALASNQERARNSHYEFLGSVLRSEEKARDAIFYSYTKYINGFAATMEEEEAMEISKHPSVISVFPNRGHKLHTTRSWEFLGMEKDGRVRANSIWAKARFGEGVIIGNLDTGVWPEAGSFSDDGMGPAPARWRGICQDQSSDAQARCNSEFPAYLVLDNKKKMKGQSLSPVRLPDNKYYPLIRSEEAKATNATAEQSRLCIEGTLDKTKVEGKIVVCMRGKNARVEKGEAVRRAGGVGLVLANDEATGNEMIADAHVLRATHITYSDGVALLAYMNSSRSASGYITVANTALGTKPAPFMAAFFSQGPNTITPQILKVQNNFARSAQIVPQVRDNYR